VPGPDGFPALQAVVTTARGSFTGTVHSKGPYDEDDTRYNGRYPQYVSNVTIPEQKLYVAFGTCLTLTMRCVAISHVACLPLQSATESPARHLPFVVILLLQGCAACCAVNESYAVREASRA
jgi:hypothetical protein